MPRLPRGRRGASCASSGTGSGCAVSRPGARRLRPAPAVRHAPGEPTSSGWSPTARARPGSPYAPAPAARRDQVVVAFPWRWRGRGVALGESLATALGPLVDGTPAEGEQVIRAAVAHVSAAEPGARPVLVTPRIPVASVTGTNGKTTTTRLLAHIGMTAGLVDRVELHRRRRRPGRDRRGGRLLRTGRRPGRARGARASQLGILETARGGHAAQGHGRRGQRRQRRHQRRPPTTSGCRASTPSTSSPRSRRSSPGSPSRPGWVVLNGDDPRVWAMRSRHPGRRPWAFSLDPDSPALRESLDAGGRAITVLDGDLVVLSPGGDPDRLVQVVDVPVTLSGLSRAQHRQRARGRRRGPRARPAPRGRGRGAAHVRPGPAAQPGPDERLLGAGCRRRDAPPSSSTWPTTRPGLEALLEVAEGLRPPGGRRAPRPGHRRRPHRRHPRGARRDRRPARRPGDRGAQGALPARALDARTSRPTCGSAWPGSGSATSTRYPTELDGLQALVADGRRTATCWR